MGTTIVPEDAIACGSSGDGNGCYLGISVYSDSICSDQMIGKVNMVLQKNSRTKKRYGLAYIVDYWKVGGGDWEGEGGTCPFFKFLTLN